MYSKLDYYYQYHLIIPFQYILLMNMLNIKEHKNTNKNDIHHIITYYHPHILQDQQ